MKYDRKKTHEILSDAAYYVDDDVIYKINYVPSLEEIDQGEQILMQVDELGDPVYFNLDDIDLNNPGVHVYRLVLSNPL